jgi:hypothetical protein
MRPLMASANAFWQVKGTWTMFVALLLLALSARADAAASADRRAGAARRVPKPAETPHWNPRTGLYELPLSALQAPAARGDLAELARVAERLGVPIEDVRVRFGDTQSAPYGMGTYASRSATIGSSWAAFRAG